MKTIVFSLLSLLIFGCQPKDEPMDVAGRAAGRYAIQFYVVDGDTLFSINGKNKLVLKQHYIDVGRKSSDTVVVEYGQNLNSLPFVNFSNVPVGGARVVQIEELRDRIRLFTGTKAPFLYESSIQGGRFYEPSIGYNIDSLKARLTFDSLRSPYTPPLREITISAQRSR